jgi:lysophospholipase L1-like esterase
MSTKLRVTDLSRKLALLLISTVLGLGMGEAFSRIFHKIDSPYFTDTKGNREQLLIPDNELGHRSRPNFDGWLVAPEFRNRIQTDSDGFRGRNHLPPGKNGKLRIMALGDSFTFGYGVEEDEVFENRTAALLQNTLSIPVEVLNLGVVGYGTVQEFLLFRKYAYLQPDIVVLGFFARDAFAEEGGNDLVDNYLFVHRSTEGRTGQMENYLSFTRRARAFLKGHSNLYRLTELYFGGYLRRRYSPETENPELKREAWAITADYLSRFDAELQSRNIVCFLVWIPFPSTIVRQNHSVADRIAALGLHNIVLLDPLEAMKSNPMDYYYSLDSHWNAKGHDLIANLLANRIIGTGMLDETRTPLRKRKPQ